MAIAKVDRIEIIGLQKDKERFLSLLQELGLVELVSAEAAKDGKKSEMPSDAEILGIEEALSYLRTFKEKTSFFGGMINLRPIIHKEEIRNVIDHFDHGAFLKELSKLRTHLKNLMQHKEKLSHEKQLLNPWRNITIPLDEIRPTEKTGIILGVFNIRDYPKIIEEFAKEGLEPFCEIVNEEKTNAYVVMLYLNDGFERLQAILKNYRFNFITLTHHKCTVKERLYAINTESLMFDDQIKEFKTQIAGLLKEESRLMALYDHLLTIRGVGEADKNLGRQQFTFSLRGWIKHKDVNRFNKMAASHFKHLALFISEPAIDEKVPVELENPKIIQPFEFITKIYGCPKYSEVDPTPYLAPFFFLYFGFCVSDVGYGFMLALISLFALKKFKMGPQGLRFFRLFFYCGISTIIIGALTGGWFGNAFDLLADANALFLPLKRFKDSLIMLDPMKEPTKLLGIALSFGIVQVWFGNIVAAVGNIKNKRYLDILLDQIPMLTLLFGLTGLGVIFLKLFDSTYIGIFKYAAGLGAVALLLTQGRSEKGIGPKLFFGAYNLYSALSGYLSDILSYSRLWALGLVTGVMATTINLISVQFSQIFVSIIPFVDKIVFIKVIISSLILAAIFISGHLISFFMNLLGAFVHPVRLQFVEFFSKFFKSGGSAFKPFKIETKYFNVK